MIAKIITDEPNKRITIKRDNTRFAIVREAEGLPNGFDGTIYNPREAQEIADFINEHNEEYKKENGGWDWIKVHK